MTTKHFGIVAHASVLISLLYWHTLVTSSCQGHVCALQHMFVCSGGGARVSMNPRKISIPFVKYMNNSERCSIGKWQTGFSCLSWSGLEAHGWTNKERQNSCVPLPFCVPVHHNHQWILTRLFTHFYPSEFSNTEGKIGMFLTINNSIIFLLHTSSCW